MQSDPEEIIKIVADYYGIPEYDIKSKSRDYKIVLARHIAMYFIKSTGFITCAKVGSYFYRDHSTITHAIKSVNDQLETNKNYRRQVEDIKTRMKNSYHELCDDVWGINDWLPGIFTKIDLYTN